MLEKQTILQKKKLQTADMVIGEWLLVNEKMILMAGLNENQ